MQDHKKRIAQKNISSSLFFFLPSALMATAQVSSVEFGKNRVQYKKFKWQYYQTRNFNTYFNKGWSGTRKICVTGC